MLSGVAHTPRDSECSSGAWGGHHHTLPPACVWVTASELSRVLWVGGRSRPVLSGVPCTLDVGWRAPRGVSGGSLGRGQGQLRFPGPLGLARRPQWHPVPSGLFCFAFFCQKPKRLVLPFQGKASGFFFLGGLLLCGRLSRAGASLVAVCGLLVVGAALVEHGLWGVWASVAADHRLSSCSCQALAQ